MTNMTDLNDKVESSDKHQIQKAMSSDIQISNQTTIDAINEAEEHSSIKSYSSVKEMFKDLDKDIEE